MKIVKKMLALMLTVLMLVGLMATTALADDSIKITVKNEAADHQYTAYQVFKGDLNAEGVLSNVTWGDGIDSAAFLTALKSNSAFLKKDDGGNEVNMFAAAVDAEDVAQVITGWPYNEANIKNFADVVAQYVTNGVASGSQTADKTYVMTVSSAGYYFIKDTGSVGVEGATDYLLKITNNVEITPKVSQPTFDKNVNSDLNGTFSKAISAQVGDTVWFKLEIGLPSLLNDYKQFHVKVDDILPAGLVPVTGSSKDNIYIQHANNTTKKLTAETTVEPDSQTGNTHVVLHLEDIKTQLKGVTLNLNDKIIIKYAATVTSDAVYGLNGAQGNENEAILTFSNNMNQAEPADHDDLETATMTSSASVYVYQAEFTKVDSVSKAPLKDAEFYLYRNVVENGANVKQYATINADGVITGWGSAKPATKLVSGADGKFVVKGLNALTYHLEEVTAPSGYNKMDEDVLFTIAATITDQNLTAVSMTVDGVTTNGDVATGLVTGNINNTAGTKLPTTGGIGTTIFYIAGAVMVLGAVAIFMTKKRNEA